MRIIRPTVICAVLLTTPLWAEERPSPMQPGEAWESLQFDVFGTDSLVETPGALSLDAPFRAHDPALVPVRVTQPAGGARIEELTLMIDENPSPVAATFTLGEAMHPLDMEVRVRVNAYSNVRAVARTDGGDWAMAGRFVRATGGCAAPAGKDAEAALAHLGQTRFQPLSAETGGGDMRREAKLMIRHPNYSGLQRDQITLLTIPARFIDLLEVRQGEELLFSMTGGISISEDPVFTFRYRDNGAGEIVVRAVDTEGVEFGGTFPVPAG
ncbi:quinoprotein dehydrogenase-associated SoxYZ-like carrier [Cereibacter azotoformans]|uniref:Sulfur-oxidizing protein SoxY n=1 Tax=Cereibacter azotoformans TaxID=43057 RepID=A0A2T5KB79_9RHOB|nr:quinoprotein dehydrogenase-associated SoxYZ-like carrier [Cereibacter azotoformans]AXQ93846.1 quinoprotein dehydrogenase-associated SoxYZ-like carrier [Cereibacter sphaeroides]MBO4168349.1 quinoprotein dehydrogenase-associated SoxYZ-like carrier [Cereibacter azotoformans]PTR19664.1 sulfur-oxidizing protein SoxY [Cereibacter azotoformans]UIJ29360.1 quinoprotein dehydrogenase-associated SoxYZ-like carrier [Cereibacter azotoformans]